MDDFCGTKEFLDSVMAIIISVLGVGYDESVYREALKLELKKLDVKFECNVNVPITYKSVIFGDSQEIGKVEIDFVITRDRGAAIVVLHVVDKLSRRMFNQVERYKQITGIEEAYIVHIPPGAQADMKKVVDVRKV